MSSSKPQLVYRNNEHFLALGLKVIGNVIHTVGPFARRQPEFDEAEARAPPSTARRRQVHRYGALSQVLASWNYPHETEL